MSAEIAIEVLRFQVHFTAIPLIASWLLQAGYSMPLLPPLKTVPHVEIERFMIPWFVIASIPTFIEEGAHNAVEEYMLRSDGDIDVNFTFNKEALTALKRVCTQGASSMTKKQMQNGGCSFCGHSKRIT